MIVPSHDGGSPIPPIVEPTQYHLVMLDVDNILPLNPDAAGAGSSNSGTSFQIPALSLMAHASPLSPVGESSAFSTTSFSSLGEPLLFIVRNQAPPRQLWNPLVHHMNCSSMDSIQNSSFHNI